MSTYAAIFMKDEETNRYNGISVKYDGYLEGGVGETLYRYWKNPEDVKKLCCGKRSDMRILGSDFESSEWFHDETIGRNKSFKNLHFQKMLDESANISYDYTYVFEDYTDGPEWFLIDRENNDSMKLLADIFDK